MKKYLGLLLLTLAPPALPGTSSSLILRATIAPKYSVELSSKGPRLLSNVKDSLIQPVLKAEKQGQNYLVTITHP